MQTSVYHCTSSICSHAIWLFNLVHFYVVLDRIYSYSRKSTFECPRLQIQVVLVAYWCLISSTVSHIKGKIIENVLMHIGVINGYQLLCNAHTVSLCWNNYGGTAASYPFYSLSSFSAISFVCLSFLLMVLFPLLGASINCVLNLTREAGLFLWIPPKLGPVYTHYTPLAP